MKIFGWSILSLTLLSPTVIGFSGTGEAIYEATAPDTITSWVASAFAISDETGLGVAPTTSKVTFSLISCGSRFFNAGLFFSFVDP